MDVTIRVAGAVLCALSISPAVVAHETDQYTVPVGKQFADLGDYFNAYLYDTIDGGVSRSNEKIRKAMETGRHADYIAYLQSDDRLLLNVYGEFTAAFFLIENFESMLHAPRIKRQYPGRVVGYRETIRNIYQHVHFPLDPRQIFRLWHASTMQVYGRYFGPDKMGHFADMGFQYYEEYRDALKKGATEEEAIQEALDMGINNIFFGERGMVGFGSAGAYSNADLAANWVGFKFYLNLTREVSLKGEMAPPLVERDGDYWRLAPHVRRDTRFFEAFVSDHFNEALNPSHFEKGMRNKVRDAVKARTDRLLEWYADDNGNRRPKEYFDAKLEDLFTYYGDDYGHRGDYDELISIGNTCFGDPPAEDETPTSDNGYTPLHWAALRGETARAAGLIASGADVDAPVRSLERYSAEWGDTPLHLAAGAGRIEMVRVLLDAGADVNRADERGATALHRGSGDPAFVGLLLSAGAEVSAADERGRTPLHWLARYANAQSARLLLDAGADPQATDHRGETPLHRAAMWGNTTMMRTLLAAGVSATARADLGTTPLHFAVRQGDPSAITILLDHGADIDAADEFGLTPLHDVARRGRWRLAEVLLAAGADPDARDHFGSAPLHAAVRAGKRTTVNVLLAAGADVNAASDAGTVPLHEAAFIGDISMVNLLVLHRADPLAENARGQTAIQLASSCGNTVAALIMSSSRITNGVLARDSVTLPESRDPGGIQ